MLSVKSGIAAIVLALASAPAFSTVTDGIVNPASQWNGIDWWSANVPGHSLISDTFDFTIPTFMKIDIYVQGDPTLQFSNLLLNGVSLASNFTISYGSPVLKATGYAEAGAVSLKFLGDYNCTGCWGSAYNGYVQVTQAVPPQTPIANVVPEPATWAMILAGLGFVGAMLRRGKRRVNFA